MVRFRKRVIYSNVFAASKKMMFMLHSSFKYQDMSDPDQESTYMWRNVKTFKYSNKSVIGKFVVKKHCVSFKNNAVLLTNVGFINIF